MLLAESYLHTLDPFAIRFPASWPIGGLRWYGLAYAFAFVVGWVLARWIAGKSWSPLPRERVGDFIFAAVAGVLLGGRLGYAVFYDPHLFIGVSKSLPYWDLLAINQGGMSSHGGMIGVVIASIWWGVRNRVELLHLLDIGALAATIGLGVGRIANFINAELWGKPLPSDQQSCVTGAGLTGIDPPWWSIKYPHELIERWLPAVEKGKQTQAEFEQSIAIAANDFNLHAPMHELQGLVGDEVDVRLQMIRSHVEPIVSGSDALDRVVKILADTASPMYEQVAAAISPLLTAYYPSQFFQAITDGPITLAILALVWLKPRRPGTACAAFLLGYGLLRIASEAFRQPDAGVGLTFGLLSRGQTLSVLMIAGGIFGLWLIRRRGQKPIGGLFTR